MPNKRRLFIIGAGNFGREMESWLELIPEQDRDWYIAGYLDSIQVKGKLTCPSNYDILGNEKSFPLTKNDLVVIATCEPSVKEKIYFDLKDKTTFFTYISPQAVIGKFNQIGEGSIICPNCVITTNVIIGLCVTINIGAQIGHDSIIGDFSSLMPNVDIAGKCKLGERVYMGTNSTIVPGKKIVRDVKISAGSIVIKNIRNESVVFGNPAMKIK